MNNNRDNLRTSLLARVTRASGRRFFLVAILIVVSIATEIVDSQTKSVKTIGQEGFTQIGIPFIGRGANP